jgi:hypothetical protein
METEHKCFADLEKAGAVRTVALPGNLVMASDENGAQGTCVSIKV